MVTPQLIVRMKLAMEMIKNTICNNDLFQISIRLLRVENIRPKNRFH